MLGGSFWSCDLKAWCSCGQHRPAALPPPVFSPAGGNRGWGRATGAAGREAVLTRSFCTSRWGTCLSLCWVRNLGRKEEFAFKLINLSFLCFPLAYYFGFWCILWVFSLCSLTKNFWKLFLLFQRIWLNLKTLQFLWLEENLCIVTKK